VLGEGIAQASRWRASGITLKLSVNVSAVNLEEDDFLDRLQSKLAAHALPPSCLELELTESAMMGDSAKATALMSRISAIGVDLAIDDFGTGYSSLSYLQQLPARVLKIDRSFMHGLATEDRARVLVRTMIELAHKFDYRVVAEGVETADIYDVLERSGCDEVQGYLLAKPLSPSDFGTWLRWFAQRNLIAA
jgi:EAL domain-containing protein (putative c-di-GMP-specific phosphodiesterase class I)